MITIIITITIIIHAAVDNNWIWNTITSLDEPTKFTASISTLHSDTLLIAVPLISPVSSFKLKPRGNWPDFIWTLTSSPSRVGTTWNPSSTNIE